MSTHNIIFMQKYETRLQQSMALCHHQIPMLHANVANSVIDGWMDEWKNNVALAQPYH